MNKNSRLSYYFERAQDLLHKSKRTISLFKESYISEALSNYNCYKNMGGKKVDTALDALNAERDAKNGIYQPMLPNVWVGRKVD